MPTDLIPSVLTSVIVAFKVIIFEFSVNADGPYSVSMDVGNCGIAQERLSLYCLFTFLQTLK